MNEQIMVDRLYPEKGRNKKDEEEDKHASYCSSKSKWSQIESVANERVERTHSLQPSTFACNTCIQVQTVFVAVQLYVPVHTYMMDCGVAVVVPVLPPTT